jgi:hypothetical protein
MSQLNADAPPSDSKTSAATATTASHGSDQTTPTVIATASGNLPYVQLDPKYMLNLRWSNNPHDLYVEVYFDKSQPNLGADYGVDGLQPVLKEKKSDRFILRDAKKRWYIWDAWEVRLLRVQEVYTTGFETNEEIVDNILDYISLVERDAVAIWRDRTED